MSGKIEDILICENAGDELQSFKRVTLIKDKGIEGDRYFNKDGTFSEALEDQGDFQVTLIEMEEIEAFNSTTGLGYEPSAFRRNVVTSGIRLNDLVGKEFKVGDVTLQGIRLCEPCSYLVGLLGQSVMDHMLHKAGLRAVIKRSGDISIGDEIA